MYDYSPESCLIKDIDGQLYNIIDLWKGIKQPVDPSTIQRSYAPRTCLVENIDGTTVNVIDAILSIANGSGAGTSCLQEVIQARNEYRTLDERLDTENKKIYDTLNAKDYLPFKGEYITVSHSKVGYTKEMKIQGKTYQNILKKQKYYFYAAAVNDGNYTKVESVNSCVVNITKPLTSWYYLLAGLIEDNPLIKPNTKYTIVGDFKNISGLILQSGDGRIVCSNNSRINNNMAVITTNELSDKKDVGIYCYMDSGNTGEIYVKNVMILEGDYTNSYIPPYFEGIKSVGEEENNEINILSTGKNLLSTKAYRTNYNIRGVDVSFEDDIITLNGTCSGSYDYVLTIPELKLFTCTIGKKYTANCKVISGTTTGGEVNFSDGSQWNANGVPIKYGFPKNLRYYAPTGTIFNNFKIKIQIKEGEKEETYESYKQDKKEFLLPFEGGLKGLPNGAKDLIYNKEDGCYVKQIIGKYIVNGNEAEWILSTGGWENKQNVTTFEGFKPANLKLISLKNTEFLISNMNVNTFNNQFTNKEGIEGITIHEDAGLVVSINKNKLETQDVAGFKKWLQANPVTVYYEMAEPVEHQLPIDNYELKTYADVTYISSTNTISPIIDCQAPSNPQAVVADLMVANENLNNELNTKTRELQAKDQSLANEDDLLTAKDLDMDFRIFELEEQLTPEIAKLTMNHNSPYPMIKRCIEKGLYEKEDMLYKMNRYLHGKRLTQEEYDELKLMMG